VGFLPLALELAAVRVRRGVSWTELRRALEAEVARLEELEDPLQRRKGQAELKASFNYSLRALRAEDQSAYEAFVGLGLLPEDAAIAAPMAATLWEMAEAEADGLLEILWSESLLLPGAPVRFDERPLHVYRLHDLLHDLARRLLIAPPGPTRPDDLPGLGLTLREAHGRLLERYRARTQGGLWHSLPDDGYIHAHLTWHLEQASAPEGLHSLLREETAEGRNGWYDARERLGQVAGYLTDLAHTWRGVDQHVGGRSPAFGLGCRYALMTTSLNSLAGNIPTVLLAALVESGTWLPSQALAYARQVPNAVQRVQAFSRLLPRLSESVPKALCCGPSPWSLVPKPIPVLRPGQPTEHQLNHADPDLRLAGISQVFIILAVNPAPTQPAEGSLHHPPPRQQLKPSVPGKPADDLNHIPPVLRDPSVQGVIVVLGVRPQLPQARERFARQLAEDLRCRRRIIHGRTGHGHG
jgi:hypothetical protein